VMQVVKGDRFTYKRAHTNGPPWLGRFPSIDDLCDHRSPAVLCLRFARRPAQTVWPALPERTATSTTIHGLAAKSTRDPTALRSSTMLTSELQEGMCHVTSRLRLTRTGRDLVNLSSRAADISQKAEIE
jgi:hypothetical protein